MPMRAPITISGLPSRARNSNGARSSASPLCLMVTPKASHNLPGPEHSVRASLNPRRRRIAAKPSSGSSARISTALAEPSASQTKFRHQWMP